MTLENTITMNPIEASMLDVDHQTVTLQTNYENLDRPQKKVPRKVLHFSDGTLEEYSTDEEAEDEKDAMEKQVVDPKSLSWGGWMYHHVSTSGSSALAACDYLGENIAYYLGITSPKFHYEIEEAKRAQEEEEEERRKIAEEMVGWSSDGKDVSLNTISSGPNSTTSPQSLHPLAQSYLLSTSDVRLANDFQPVATNQAPLPVPPAPAADDETKRY